MIGKITSLIRLVRFSNLLLIGLTQFFAYYFLNPQIYWWNLLDANFLMLVCASMFVAAAGYIINDYMDVKLDLINKPGKVIVGLAISRRWAMLWHFFFSFSAFLMALQVNKKVAASVVVSSFLLWIYSQYLKKTYLAGNLLVSLLTANTILILYFFTPQVLTNGVWIYAGFAFLSTLIREIIKDCEDIRGDQSFKANTLPIALGIRQTKSILISLQTALIILTFMCVSLFEALSYSSSKVYMLFFMYQLLAVLIPMGICWWLLRMADTTKDFSRLSLFLKLIMLTGIFSMVFWRY